MRSLSPERQSEMGARIPQTALLLSGTRWRKWEGREAETVYGSSS